VNRDTWLRQLREHPDRPQARRQFAVLIALADQMNARTGQGTASVLDLAKAAGVSERTAKRAIGWARTAGLIEQTKRGHHLWDGTGAPSGWRLLRATPTQSASQRAAQGAKRLATPRGRGQASQPPKCRVCHRPLDTDPAVAASGVHPCCEPDDAPDLFAPRRVIPPEDNRRNAAATRAVLEAAVSKSTTRRTP
jgi:hypothetical protein